MCDSNCVATVTPLVSSYPRRHDQRDWTMGCKYFFWVVTIKIFINKKIKLKQSPDSRGPHTRSCRTTLRSLAALPAACWRSRVHFHGQEASPLWFRPELNPWEVGVPTTSAMPGNKYVGSEQATSLCPRPCTCRVACISVTWAFGTRSRSQQRVVGRELEPRVVGRAGRAYTIEVLGAAAVIFGGGTRRARASKASGLWDLL